MLNDIIFYSIQWLLCGILAGLIVLFCDLREKEEFSFKIGDLKILLLGPLLLVVIISFLSHCFCDYLKDKEFTIKK